MLVHFERAVTRPNGVGLGLLLEGPSAQALMMKVVDADSLTPRAFELLVQLRDGRTSGLSHQGGCRGADRSAARSALASVRRVATTLRIPLER